MIIYNWEKYWVGMHHPLKQGLRPLKEIFFSIIFLLVGVHHPLKQGLRLASSSGVSVL